MAGGPGSGSGARGAANVTFEQAHAELLADRSIQFDLPGSAPGDPPRPPRSDYPVPQTPLVLGSGEAGPIAVAMFWIVVGLAVAALLYLIISRLTGWRAKRDEPLLQEAEVWRPEEEPARRLLGDADALAAQGLFAEAAHLLLHRSIGEIDRRRPATIRKALTSRDIAALPAIPPAPAAAFGEIVRAVEYSLFGGRTLDEGAWRNCRAAYERFAFAGEWRR